MKEEVRPRQRKKGGQGSGRGLTLEGLDDERGGGRNNSDGGLSVLDGELDSDAEAFPVSRGLGDVFTHFLGRLEVKNDSAVNPECASMRAND